MTHRARPLWPLRRGLLAAGLAHAAGVSAAPEPIIRFPRDFGAHPDYRVEWWYITGYASVGARLFGFQVTFFRSRVDATQAMASRFAARQLIFAHAALTDVQGGKLWHDQRVARASGAPGLDLARAGESTTDLVLKDWSLQQSPLGYRARIAAQDFRLDLQFSVRQRVLLQGVQGLSQKGPQPQHVSRYYSQPQLGVAGLIRLNGREFSLPQDAAQVAWLDHEWSQALMPPLAVGWDWLGINLFDGGALTVFEMRRGNGAALWAGGSYRSASGSAPTRIFGAREVLLEPLRHWTSPASQARYPVEWALSCPAGRFRVRALIDNQELDSRASTGGIYWEGLSELLDSRGQILGRGYLEMTGYAAALKI